MNESQLLLNIVNASEGGILIYCPDVNELCRDVFEATGFWLKPSKQDDYYESQKLDYYGEPYINKRINRRKFILKIMEIKGKVHEVMPVQQVSETFKKRNLIVEYAENPTYPEYIQFEALQDKTAIFDELRPGDEVEVSFNLRGRPWTNKEGVTSYFNTLVVWKLSILKTSAAPAQQQAPAYSPPNVTPLDQMEEDDLPF